jgi:hypothetical protein
MDERATRGSSIGVGVSLVMGVGLVVLLLWMTHDDMTGDGAPIARAADPVRLTASNGHTYCVTLESGGPYPGCDQVFASVQAAVDAAGGGDVIKIATGIYTSVHSHSTPPGYISPPSSGLITQAVYIDKDITIRGGYTITDGFAAPPNATANPTTLDAQQHGRAVFVAGDIRATVEGLRITNGNASGLGGHKSGDAGGALYILSATATISSNSVFANNADNGGGLFLYNGDVMITNSRITSNTAWYLGGGLSLERGNVTLSGSTISGNVASTDGGGLHLRLGGATLTSNAIVSNTALYGGGLCLQEVDGVTLSGNTFARNTARTGGGLFAYEDDSFASSGDTFFANTAHGSGGGAYLDEDTRATLNGITVISNTAGRGGGGLVMGEDTRVTLRQSTVASNTAVLDGGGLLVVDNYDATLIDNTITGNRSDAAGGGLYACFFSVVTLDSNTVVSNSARYGGGLFFSESWATLTNNIVADNWASVAGSGLYVDDSSSLELLHTTVARNQGGDGSGLLVTGVGWSYSTVAMTNTILVGHTIGVTATTGNAITLQATLWGTGTWANEADWGGAGTVVTGKINVRGEPAFVDPDAGDYRIAADSAAIDEGICTGVRIDIEGQPRPLRAPDLGADEYWPPGTPKRSYLPLILWDS